MSNLLTLLRAPRRSSAGGFSPADIAGLQLWLDASDTSTITEAGGAVSQWDDKSSNSYAFVQANAALQPSTGTTTQAGRNTLAFAGDYLTESTNSLSAFKFLHDGIEHTIFVVSKSGLVAEPDAVYGLMGTNAGANANTGFSIFADDRSSVPRDRTIVHGISQTIANVSSAGEYIFGEHALLRVSGDPGNAIAADRSVITVNAGTEIKNNGITLTPKTGNHTYHLQIGAIGDASSPLTGEVAEILVYDSALSTVDRERVEDYLLKRWSIFRPGEFALQMETTAAGQVVEVPLAGTLNVDIDWGDGTVDSGITTAYPQHTYASAGSYDVRVTGSATTLGGATRGVEWRERLKGVYQWGDLGFTSFQSAFNGIQGNPFIPNEIPSTITNLREMFALASSFNQDIGGWNTSNVTTMYRMFFSAVSFNQNLNSWDVTSILANGLNGMFFNASSFNGDISSWNVSAITDFSALLRGTAFNQDISSWNTGSATFMVEMFRDASAFNQNIGSWNTSSVTNMAAMFRSASAFNQDISGWDFSGLNSSDDLNLFNANTTNTFSTTNYDALLIAWEAAASASPAQIFSPLSPNMGGSQYSSLAAQFARDNLINLYGWTITDGGLAAGSTSPTLWLDASDALTITESGGAVSQWSDKSGNGNDVTQALAADQPETGVLTFNGLNVLKAAGTDGMVLSPVITFTNDTATIFTVVSWDSMYRNGIYGGSAGSLQLFQSAIGTTTWISEPATATNYEIGSSSSGALISAYHGLSSQLYLDGTLLTESNGPQATVAGTNFSNVFVIGRAGVFLSGWLGEVLVYDGALPTADRQAVEAYLASKWGITIP